LVASAAALWVLLFWPARAMAGSRGVEGLTYAALLCVLPGCAVFLLGGLVKTLGGQPHLLMLAGTSLRLLAVLGGVLMIRAARPDLGFRELTLWVLVFYLATLLTETLLVTRQTVYSQSAATKSGSRSA
jgi:hypothetical protein